MLNLPRRAVFSVLSLLLALGCGGSPTTPPSPTPPSPQPPAPTPGCTFAVSLNSIILPAAGGSTAVAVTTQNNCAWTASAATSWLSTNPASGAGPGSVSVSGQANTSTQSRTSSVIIAGATVAVQQEGIGTPGVCTYTVSPVQLSACMAWPTNLVSTVTTQDGCPWTAVSTAGWMTVEASGSGAGTVQLRGTDNYDAPRNGSVEVRWPTGTGGQNIFVAQAGCFYSVSQTTFAIAATGGTGRVEVLPQSVPNSCGGSSPNGCIWSVANDAQWITITSPTPSTGDGPITFSVAPNTTGTARTGRLTVRDKVVQINQAG